MRKPPPQFTRADALQLVQYLSGYTTREIAAKCDITARSLDNGISGTYPLSDEATRAVCRFLGILPERMLAIPRTREE